MSFTLGNTRVLVSANRKRLGKKLYRGQIWAACLDCGKERWVGLVSGKPERIRCPACAAKHRYIKYPHPIGEALPFWKGGRTKTSGYIYIAVRPDNPYFCMANSNKYVAEHRLVYAQFLGRPLKCHEIIHHKNRNKTDNRLENLQLVTIDEHRGITNLEERICHLECQNRELRKQVRFLQFDLREMRQALQLKLSDTKPGGYLA